MSVMCKFCGAIVKDMTGLGLHMTKCPNFYTATTTYKANTSNPIVDAVHKLIDSQQEKGLKKYGTYVKLEDYSVIGWIEHAQQEIVDQLIYLECLKQKFEGMQDTVDRIKQLLDAVENK